MIVFVDDDNCIRDVDKTNNPSLKEVYIADETNPFKDWSKAKICCYKVTVSDGIVTGYTPYVDSRYLEAIDHMGQAIDSITPKTMTKTAYIQDTAVVFDNVPSGNMSVFVKDSSGDFPEYSVKQTGNTVVISFEPLKNVTEVTLSIL